MQINIRSSYDSFRDLRENHAYYIDKTEMLEEYLIRRFDKAVLFTRPRRFGKTLTMTMFRDFLDIRQDSRNIFNGLRIMDHPEVVKAYMNQYPVVFISLKDVSGESFEEIYSNFRLVISELCKTYDNLTDSTAADKADKAIFSALREQSANEANTVAALSLLCRMLKKHYNRQAFVIIDEYDVPMAKALGSPSYNKVREMIEHMLSFVCKTNDNVKAVMLSGCLYTVKNSVYTGVNNIIPYTVLSPIYASAIGFSDEDVKKLLADVNLSERYDTVAEWYDGYIFGRDKMYCPWDVLSYVRSVLDGSYSEAMGPESYWINTSETSLILIQGFLGKTPGANESFERLLAGETIECTVNETVPYHLIHENGENLWSALLETGYLTKTVTEKMPLMPLKIPNREIQAVFRQEVWSYFSDKVDNVYVKELVNALWAGETKAAKEAMDQILEATLSFYHEYHEYSYHLILDGFFTGLGYRVQSKRETGYGRSDLIILHPSQNRCMLLELKHVREEKDMKGALKEAESQIIRNKYDSQLKYEGYTTCIQYGMAFWGKKSLIARFAAQAAIGVSGRN